MYANGNVGFSLRRDTYLVRYYILDVEGWDWGPGPLQSIRPRQRGQQGLGPPSPYIYTYVSSSFSSWLFGQAAQTIGTLGGGAMRCDALRCTSETPLPSQPRTSNSQVMDRGRDRVAGGYCGTW